jgi:transposase
LWVIERNLERLHYIVEVVSSYLQADTIHLVMDNLSSHSGMALEQRFGDKIGGSPWDRFTVHWTPTYDSWLNQAEIEISLFSRQHLASEVFPHSRNCSEKHGRGSRK